MYKILLLTALIFLTLQLSAQDIYKLRSSKVVFFAGTPVEDIEATNTKSLSFLNIKTGEVSISIPVKEFHFKRSLMEEHFNENYIESAKYPKAEFKGKIQNIESIDFSSKDAIKVTVAGNLNIHGVTKERTIEATLINKGELIEATSKFSILVADHKIERPQILWEKIAENVQVTVNLSYELYKK